MYGNLNWVIKKQRTANVDRMKARQIYRNWAILKLVNQKCMHWNLYISNHLFFFVKKKNRLSKGLLQWNRRKKEHQMHRMKSVDNLKTAVMAFVKEHFSQIESNDGFVCTVIGKHEDSKCVWNALLLFVLDPRKIYLFFFSLHSFRTELAVCPLFVGNLHGIYLDFQKKKMNTNESFGSK